VRALAEQNYYELLEAPREGTAQQIERAYRIARATYHPSSSATYSLFSAEECSAILRRIEEAYAVLSDARLRREYDARLHRGAPPAPAPVAAPTPATAALPLREPVRAERPLPAVPIVPVAPPLRPRPAPNEVELDGGFAPDDGSYDGDALRRIRVSLGIELDEISTITKINVQHLRAIEANDYEMLPAPVYLRGFLKQIAKCLSLDPAGVADSYTERMRTSARGRA
jgi:curved DNA-binding protein CbpA